MAEKEDQAPGLHPAAKKFVAKVSDYQTVFTSEQGQRVLWDMFSNHHMMSSTFNKDPMTMAMHEGERNVILRILSLTKMDAAKVQKLIRESDKHAESIHT